MLLESNLTNLRAAKKAGLLASRSPGPTHCRKWQRLPSPQQGPLEGGRGGSSDGGSGPGGVATCAVDMSKSAIGYDERAQPESNGQERGQDRRNNGRDNKKNDDGPPKKDVQAILFDMDGVLCDSEQLSRSTGVRVLRDLYGVEAREEDFLEFTGTGEANFLAGVAKKYGVRGFDVTAAKARFVGLYLDEAARAGDRIAYPGAVELVRACKKAGLKTAVASSADMIKVMANLRAAGFTARADFDALVSADKFENLKPAPDVFLAAARQLGIAADKCVVVEDAPAGIQAARAAGMRCVGLATSLSIPEMANKGPDAVRRQIGDLRLIDLLELESAQDEKHAKKSKPRIRKPRADQDWLDSAIEWPNGRTTKRSVLVLAPLLAGWAAAAGYSLWENRESVISYMNANVKSMDDEPPKKEKKKEDEAPKEPPKEVEPEYVEPEYEEVPEEPMLAKFKRYIAEKEESGDMREVQDFPEGATWFNTSPLKLKEELKGRVLVYDFWTYASAKSIHELPALAALEKRYADQPVTVVGVHSAKFDNEKDDETIRNAIVKYEVEHPCVNDQSRFLWRDLGITTWPTLAVISPSGKLIATLPGEGKSEVVDNFIQAALSYYGDKGELESNPLPLYSEREKVEQMLSSPLRYPGKIASDLAGERLFIADTSNDRIVITSLTGKFIDHIGGTGQGFKDGKFERASFSRPQGLVYSPGSDILYVADTENHALRKVDLKNRKVTTVAGNGRKGRDYVGGGSGRGQQLNGPWDVAFGPKEESLYIAMAGQNQIWKHNVESGTTSAFSGDGFARNANGSTGKTTSWAQPSGLALSADGKTLYVADSESSSIRSLSLETGGSQANVGGDPIFSDNLFKFGNKDGARTDARLQHPLAVCTLSESSVIVADSYNHQLKRLDPRKNVIRSLAGSGNSGSADGKGLEASLSEPGGLAPGPKNTFFVADTNNHRIRSFNLAKGALTTLQLEGVPAPRGPQPEEEEVEEEKPSEEQGSESEEKGSEGEKESEGKAPEAKAEEASSKEESSSKGEKKEEKKEESSPKEEKKEEEEELETGPQGPVYVQVEPIVASSGELSVEIDLPKGYRLANSRFEITSGSPGAISFDPSSGPLEEEEGKAVTRVQFMRSSGADANLTATVYFTKDGERDLFQEVVFELPFSPEEYNGETGVDLKAEVKAYKPNRLFDGDLQDLV